MVDMQPERCYSVTMNGNGITHDRKIPHPRIVQPQDVRFSLDPFPKIKMIDKNLENFLRR